jgi:hypothetical protein
MQKPSDLYNPQLVSAGEIISQAITEMFGVPAKVRREEFRIIENIGFETNYGQFEEDYHLVFSIEGEGEEFNFYCPWFQESGECWATPYEAYVDAVAYTKQAAQRREREIEREYYNPRSGL